MYNIIAVQLQYIHLFQQDGFLVFWGPALQSIDLSSV